MLNTAASCCSSSSGSGASEPRATVCSETVVSAPARAPAVIQPAVLSLWLMGSSKSSSSNIHLRKDSDALGAEGFPTPLVRYVKKARIWAGTVLQKDKRSQPPLP